MRVVFLVVFLFLVSCGSSTEGTDPDPVSKDNLASPELVELNQAAAKAQATALELAELVLKPGGIAERTQAIRTLPLTTAAEIQAWRAERDALRTQIDAMGQKSANFALELAAVERNRRLFLADQALYFPVRPEELPNNPQGLTTVQQPLVVAALAIATLSIGGYRFLKGFGKLANHTQRMVYTTAEGEPASRAAVIRILKDNGVELPDTATAEQVIEIFDAQPRNLRRTITTQVEAWNEDQFIQGTQESEDALERFEEAREDVPEISNEGGALAATQTVTFVQSVTGGVGSIVGGVPGAVIDLGLTATEMNPTDIVQRRVTVYVTSGEKEPLPTETTTTPPTIALETIEKAAAGDPDINPEQIIDAATALIQEIADGLRTTFGPTVQLAQRFALSSSELTEEPQEDGTFKQDATLPLPHFSQGETAEVVIVREGMLPQEVMNYTLGIDPPIVLDGPPLLGTITVESEPGEATADSQLFSVTANVIRVPAATELICSGTNVICTPNIAPLATDGSVVFSVEVIGQGELKLVRRDTGESYSLALKASAGEPEPEPEPTNNPSAVLDPALFGTWTFVDSEGEVYFWRFGSDGSCTQGTPTGDYEWEWRIENDALRLSVGSGTPNYYLYKIEGNQLFFWVLLIDEWGLPFTKE